MSEQGTRENMPGWARQLINAYIVGNYHQFLIDGNIRDLDYCPLNKDREQWFRPVRQILIDVLFDGLDETPLSVEYIFYYTRSSGIRVFSRNARNLQFIPDFTELGGDEQKVLSSINVPNENLPGLPLMSLYRLDKALKTEWSCSQKRGNTPEENKPVQVAVILDHAEQILPDQPGGSAPSSDANDRAYYELIRSWSQEQCIAELGHLVILLTENRSSVLPGIRSKESGTYPVSVPIPDGQARYDFFNWAKDMGCDTTNEEDSSHPLHAFLQKDAGYIREASLATKGFGLMDCHKIMKISACPELEVQADYFGSHPTWEQILEFLQDQKDEVINGASRGMLEIVSATTGFETIGGLDGAKGYFERVATAIKSDDEQFQKIIPKGVLLTGPPGTGKSLLAKALARETGINLVRMGNIRSMWVGESEKNLSLVLNLLKAMAPTIVFVDEIDQALGARQSASGDSGVSGRIFQQILEFMGDNANRGQVIWIAATNRADLLDDAMVSRFDRIIPVLLPGSEEEWAAVLKGILKQLRIDGEKTVDTFLGNEENRKFLQQHSGRSMESVVRLAYQDMLSQPGADSGLTIEALQNAFGRFKTNINEQMYELQTLLAVAACNEIPFIGKPGEGYSYGFRGLDDLIQKSIDKRSNEPLEGRIIELKTNLRC